MLLLLTTDFYRSIISFDKGVVQADLALFEDILQKHGVSHSFLKNKI